MRCPVCRADVEQGPNCRRCRADLTLLFALEEQRGWTLHEAYRAFARGEFRRAHALAEGAAALREDEESSRLRAVCSLVRRDFGRAWKCYRNVVDQRSSG